MTRACIVVCLAVGLAGSVLAQTPAMTRFNARAETLRGIEQAQSGVSHPEAKAEWALHWVEAVQRTAEAIPFGEASKRDPYASWIRAHASQIVYNEPGGRWMLRPAWILGLHRTYPAMAAADDLAWILATNGLPGECEGDIPCSLDRGNRTYGTYVALHPSGRHIEAALASLADSVKRLVDEPSYRRMFVRTEQCDRLDAPAASLASTVRTTHGYPIDGLLASLERLRSWCQ